MIRWNSSALGFVNPADFIPLAEYLGLINPIGEYVMKNAALRCKYWNDMGHPEYHVNVNLSVVQLLQNDIVKKVAKVLEETRIIPQNLTLEVTESLAINDMVRMKKILSEIRNLGVRVALDDFGTGYSSLNHIREMPLDVIKIDRCFIEHLGEDDFSNAFVRMVSELANAINVRVCVEGVETKRQRDIVKKMGIRMIQGFFYGKPSEETQIYDNNTYEKGYTYLGIVGPKNEKGMYRVEQKNKFSVGEQIEVMKPDGRNMTVTVRGLMDEKGEPMESCPHPQQIFYVDLGMEPDEYDILRRREEEAIALD